MNSPFVRRFREEREQAVILAVDVSGSMHYASSAARASKLDYAAEVAAVLAFSAARAGTSAAFSFTGTATPITFPRPRASSRPCASSVKS